jgi:tripartite-type tricarboxylate transporter receptor subunit TctC
MGRHIPGKPRVVAKSMPGAGSLKALKVLYKRSKKDGSVFGAVFQGALMEPLLGKRGVEFDALKLNYVGELNSEPKICFAWNTSKVMRFEDLQSMQMIVGASGSTSGLFQYATVLKNVLGAKLQVIAGYKGSAGASLAMQRGETQGMCGFSWSSFATKHDNWIAEKKVRILVQIGQMAVPRLTKMGVPEVWKFVKSADDRQAMELIFNPPGRPYIMPPGVPADRVEAMRAAFTAMTTDSKFLAESKRAKISIKPSTGAKVEALMRKLYAASPKVVKIAKAALSRRGSLKCNKVTNPKYCRSKKKKKKKKKSS